MQEEVDASSSGGQHRRCEEATELVHAVLARARASIAAAIAAQLESSSACQLFDVPCCPARWGGLAQSLIIIRIVPGKRSEGGMLHMNVAGVSRGRGNGGERGEREVKEGVGPGRGQRARDWERWSKRERAD